MNDLDRAAFRRLVRNAENAGVERTVTALYESMLSGFVSWCVPKIGAERTWQLMDAAIVMLFEDVARYRRGEQGRGSAAELAMQCLDAFDDDQARHHACRVILFIAAGCLDQDEAALRVNFREAFDLLCELLAPT